MWKHLYETIKQVLLLTHKTEQNREEIKELRRQVRELASALERLAYETHRVSEKVDYAGKNGSARAREISLAIGKRVVKVRAAIPDTQSGAQVARNTIFPRATLIRSLLKSNIFAFFGSHPLRRGGRFVILCQLAFPCRSK